MKCACPPHVALRSFFPLVIATLLVRCTCDKELPNIVSEFTLPNKSSDPPVRLRATSFNVCSSQGNHFIGAAATVYGYKVEISVGGNGFFELGSFDTENFPGRNLLDSVLKMPCLVYFSPDKRQVAFWIQTKGKHSWWDREGSEMDPSNKYYRVLHLLGDGSAPFNYGYYYDTMFLVTGSISWKKMLPPELLASYILRSERSDALQKSLPALLKSLGEAPLGNRVDEVFLEAFPHGYFSDGTNEDQSYSVLKRKMATKEWIQKGLRKELHAKIDLAAKQALNGAIKTFNVLEKDGTSRAVTYVDSPDLKFWSLAIAESDVFRKDALRYLVLFLKYHSIEPYEAYIDFMKSNFSCAEIRQMCREQAFDYDCE